MRTVAPLLLAALALGCGAGDTADEGVGAVTQPVVAGELSGPELEATVLVVFDYEPATPGAFLLGSGVLIAPNVIVTARHNIVDSSPPNYTNSAPYICGGDGEPVEDGNGGGYVSAEGAAENIKVYVGNLLHDVVGSAPAARGVQVFDDASPTLCSHDIAFVLLDRAIEEVRPVQLRWSTPPAVGESIELVGWGMTDGGAMEFAPLSHYLDDLPIIAVGPEIPDPTQVDGQTVPRTFETGPGICHGDSGGSALDEDGMLLGIALRFTGMVSPNAPDPCAVSTNESVFIQVRLFADQLDEVLAAAGQVAWLEGSPEPGSVSAGEACGADYDCKSGLCQQRESGGVCGRACQSDADCSQGDVCHTESGFCEVAEEAPKCSVGSAPRGTSRWALVIAALGLALASARRVTSCSRRAAAGSRSARVG
jgi:trypsin